MTSFKPTQPARDRANTDLANLVDAALELRNQEDERAAIALLTDAGAGFAMTARVLREPARRRPPR